MPILAAPTMSSPASHSQGSNTSPAYHPSTMQSIHSPTTDAAMLSSFAAVSATAVIPPTSTIPMSSNHIPVVMTTPASRGGVIPVAAPTATAATNQYNMALVTKPRVNTTSGGFGSIPTSLATNTPNMGSFGRTPVGSTNATLLANAPASLRTIAFGRPAHVSVFGIAQAFSSQSTYSSSHHGNSSPNSPTDYASPLPPHIGAAPTVSTTRSAINGYSGTTPRTLLPSNSTHHFTPAVAAAAMVVTPPLASHGTPTPITTPATLPTSEQYQDTASIPVMQLVPHSRAGTFQGLGLRSGNLRQARSGINVRRADHPSPNGSDQSQEYDGHEDVASGPNAEADDDEHLEHEDEPVHDHHETEGNLTGKDEESSQLNKRYALRQQVSLMDTTQVQQSQKYYFAPSQTMRRATSCSAIATSGTSSWNNSPTVHAKKVHSPSHLHIPLQNLEVSSRTSAPHQASGSAMASSNHFVPHSLLQLTAANHHSASVDKRSQRTLCQVELNILTRLYCEGASTAFVARIFDVSERTIQRKYKELTDQKRMLEQQQHIQHQSHHLNHHLNHQMQRRLGSSHSLSSMSSDSAYHDTTIVQVPEYTDVGDQTGESAFMDNTDDASSQASGVSGAPNESYALGLQQRKRGRTRKDYREIDMIMRSLYLQTPHIGGKEVRDILMRDYNISIALTQVYDRKKALREDPTFVAAHNAALHAANQSPTSDGNSTDGSMDSPPSHLNHLVHAQPEFGPRMRITRSMNNLIEAHAAQLTSDGEHPVKRVAVDTSLLGR